MQVGEIDRARAIWVHASSLSDPRTDSEFWTEWKDFEVWCQCNLFSYLSAHSLTGLQLERLRSPDQVPFHDKPGQLSKLHMFVLLPGSLRK